MKEKGERERGREREKERERERERERESVNRLKTTAVLSSISSHHITKRDREYLLIVGDEWDSRSSEVGSRKVAMLL